MYYTSKIVFWAKNLEAPKSNCHNVKKVVAMTICQLGAIMMLNKSIRRYFQQIFIHSLHFSPSQFSCSNFYDESALILCKILLNIALQWHIKSYSSHKLLCNSILKSTNFTPQIQSHQNCDVTQILYVQNLIPNKFIAFPKGLVFTFFTWKTRPLKLDFFLLNWKIKLTANI